MRTKFVASVIVVALWAGAAPAQNQVPNWEFDQQVNLTTIWNLWQAASFTGITIVEGAGLSGRYAMKVDCAGALDPMQFFRSYLKLEQGKKYYISFMAKAVAPRPISVGLEARALYNWVTYWQADIQLTTEAQLFNFTYTHTGATVGGTGTFDSDIDLQFWLAGNGTDFYLDRVWMGTEPPPSLDKTRATDPVPVIGATDLAVDPSLSWTPGAYAATHNVYLGTSLADVNTADATKPQLVSQGQTETTYKVSTPLEYGKTYYWRVDEVNAPPSTAVAKGDVWSFTVEPYTYPITSVTATASSYDKATTTPTNTVNGSGLTGDLHGISLDTMWTSSMTGPTPVWIQYQFDKAYKLSELWVWNHNTEMETILGYGLKDVTIEYSLDGTTWTLLKDMQFAQAPAMAGYAHNTTVDFAGVMARYVKITAKSNWSLLGLKQYGLSEVRFFYIPVQARTPQPTTGATGVSTDANMDWRPGRDAASQKVYLGTDKAAVTNGTAPVQVVTKHGFDPSSLNFGTTYYWKVDEIGAATYPGDVWKFTTEEYAVVDNFESYDDKDNRIYDTWTDGMVNKTSALVGYWQAPFAEKTLVHAGNQSMPLEYNNINAPFYSETDRTFDTPLDLTANGATTLSLYFLGYPVGYADKGNNAFSVASTGADIWGTADQFRFVYKTLSGNGSITARVDSLTRADAWTKAGVMIRETLDAGSKHVSTVVTPDNSCSQQYRTNTGGASASTDWTGTAVKAPYWVRVTRTGNVFKTETSADGKTWAAQGPDQTVAMVANVYVGLCVTSHNAAAYSAAEFSNVATTGTGSWQNLSIGVTQRSNGTAPLYVRVEDKAGKTKTIVNPDPAAVNKGSWTQWQIALSDLTGVNLAAVKKLTIGVGDKASPKAGAAGMLYIDDILFGNPIKPVGLVANYTFENNLKDVTGNGHDGTLIGAPTYVTGAPGLGTGMLFPGPAGNAVDLGTFNPSEKTGMLSVSLWAKWNGLSTQWQGLIGKRNTWADGQTMWQIEANQTTGALSFSRYNITGATAPVLTVGQWTHIALTFDKTVAQFYINGAKAGAPSAGTFSFGSKEDAELLIGCDNAGGGNAFNGVLDEVRLYDVALTPAEVLTLAGK
jgi:regulation of enolase protein 1 (concanavalin A-like superfamily)